MTHELSNVEKTRKLPWALSGDVTNMVYVYLAMGGPIVLLFLDKIGLDKTQIGLILGIISLTSIIVIFAGPICARVGIKRMFLTVWATRKVIFLGMIAVPWVAVRYGEGGAFALVLVLVSLFALCRALGDASLAPWSQEFVPPNIRGKFTAAQMTLTTLTAAITVAVASRFLGKTPELDQFQWLFGVAFIFGLACVACYSRVPGGQPVLRGSQGARWADTLIPARDRRFVRFLIGGALVTLAWTPMFAFLPLFMKDFVGLRADQVVFLDAGMMVGQLCSSFLWGWAADRYGGKPTMVFNLALLLVCPLGLLMLPRESPHSPMMATTLYFVVGIILPGWSIGYWRYLFVNLIPPSNKTPYLALHSTITGTVNGLCPLMAGFVLEHTQSLSGQWLWFHLDPYTPFFLSAIVLIAAAVPVMASLPAHGGIPISRFATLWVQGNPIAALSALIAYQFAAEETHRVATIEKLGQTKSPLSDEELIAALQDPSFNVRYEALISIARARRDPRLTAAVVKMLQEADSDLRTTAAWALGRMGDPDACAALRPLLTSAYPLLRARVARSLGTLNDQQSADEIVAMFRQETDPGLRVAYVAALAALGSTDAAGDILAFLRQVDNLSTRREASLALATLVGRDVQALRLWRRMHDQPGDTLGGVMLGLRRRLTHPTIAMQDPRQLEQTLDHCARALAREDMTQGARDLQTIARSVNPQAYSPVAWVILQDACDALNQFGTSRVEYIFLAVHTLHVGLVQHPV
jgi:MFS family permease